VARLYTNENFPQQVVDRLRALGHDVETSHDAGNSGHAMPDELVLDYAIRQERTVLTFNRRHFVALHVKHPDHCGIIVCTFDTDFDALADRIHATLTGIGGQRSSLIRINRPG
jgi:predicted nuclease of predicted toxin-antitoxin system